jgi:C-terminal processing protease CtpA/Prc
MQNLRPLILLLPLLLIACMSDDQKTRLEQQSSIPLTCLPGADCQAKWARARQWVEDNSHFPILRATDRLIEVDSSPDTFSPVVTVRMVTKTEDADDNSIVFTAECQNMLGCVPTELQYKASFADFVNDTPAVPEVFNDANLGVTYAPQQKTSGVILASIKPGSPAAIAGWQKGDHVVKFNGHPVSSGAELDGLVTDTPPGSVFPVQIIRGGKTIVSFMQL